MPQLSSTFLLTGGMNLVTPAVAIPNGMAIDAANYEADVSGYSRTRGYERYDGRPKPSAATYWILNFTAGSVAILEGEIVTGATSSASGKALAAAVITSGSYAGGNAVGYLVLTAVSGTFQTAEALQVAAVTRATASGTAIQTGAATDADNTTHKRDAIETARALIQPPPGSGAIRGVWTYGGARYAFRDNVGATAGKMFKATAGGWQEQAFGYYLNFDTTSGEFVEGGTLLGGTSAATGIIRRVVRTSGDWGSTAVGYLVLGNVVGVFQDNEAISAAGITAVADGLAILITLPAGGRYDFTNHNFYGATKLERMYFVNGVGRAHEWDGTSLVPIRSGLSDALDKPEHIGKFQMHLFLSFAGGSLQHSGTGNPLSYRVVDGAGEIGIGQEITDLLDESQTSLVIVSKTLINYLTGSDAATWVLSPFTNEAGGKAWTAQNIGGPIFMDQMGVRRMSASQNFGNWRMNSVTEAVQPIFDRWREASVEPVASLRVRKKDQYRLYMNDSTGITIYFGRKIPEVFAFDLPIQVSCACSGEDATGNEILLVGAEDGYVYQMDSGTSFDGAEVPAFIRMAFNAVGSPTQKKRFHTGYFGIVAGTESVIGMTSEVSYGDPDEPSGPEREFAIRGGGGFWDRSIWNEFYWSSPVVGKATIDIDQVGTNLSMSVISNDTYEEPMTLTDLTLFFSYRRQNRGGA